jgi:hypothetical protein
MTVASSSVSTRALFALLLSIFLAYGQDIPLCNSTLSRDFTNVNATGVYAIPGLSPPGHPNGTWTVSTAVRVASSLKSFQQGFSIDTNPAINIISDDLPWTGCVISFSRLAGKTNQRGFDDNGDCTTLFRKDCVNDLTDAIQATAKGLSGQDTENFDCGIFADLNPSSCGNNGGLAGAEVAISTRKTNNPSGHAIGLPKPHLGPLISNVSPY